MIGAAIAALVTAIGWLTAKPERLDPRKRSTPRITPISAARLRMATANLPAIPADDQFIDEADVTVPIRKRGRPRKTKPDAPVKSAKQQPPIKPQTEIIRGFRMPIELTYARGTHANQPRTAIIISVCGRAEQDIFQTDSILCRCQHAKGWRRFRIEHITSLIDLTTGEIVKNPQTFIDDHVRRVL